MCARENFDEALLFLSRQARPRGRKRSYTDELFELLYPEPTRPANQAPPKEPPAQDLADPTAGVPLTQAVTLLRAARHEQGVSLDELHLDTGISRGRLSRMENRVEVNPTIGTLDRMAEALGMRLVVRLVEAVDQAEASDSSAPKAAANVAL